jgi:two-component system, chemotaxis family, chemotaxis protein CheY
LEIALRALIVDDSRVIRTLLRKFLHAQGFDTCVEAAHGREALARLAETGPIELALIDWNMPVMNGLELVSAIRQHRAFDATKLMMVTTESETAQIVRALETGADEYIMKPFTPDALRDKLDILGFERPDA